MKTILGISGSIRAGSSNERLLLAAAKLSPPDVQVRIFRGISELPFFHPDQDSQNTPPAAENFRNLITACDGLLISSPEYAHGVPGVLKNALDWLVGHPPFEGKPIVLFCGGEFAPAQIEETLRVMSARILKAVVLSGPVLRNAFDSSGTLIDQGTERELRDALALFLSGS